MLDSECVSVCGLGVVNFVYVVLFNCHCGNGSVSYLRKQLFSSLAGITKKTQNNTEEGLRTASLSLTICMFLHIVFLSSYFSFIL